MTYIVSSGTLNPTILYLIAYTLKTTREILSIQLNHSAN